MKKNKRINFRQRSKEKSKEPNYTPACLDASDANLDDGFYCKVCGMAWYNCLCCREKYEPGQLIWRQLLMLSRGVK